MDKIPSHHIVDQDWHTDTEVSTIGFVVTTGIANLYPPATYDVQTIIDKKWYVTNRYTYNGGRKFEWLVLIPDLITEFVPNGAASTEYSDRPGGRF